MKKREQGKKKIDGMVDQAVISGLLIPIPYLFVS